MSPATVLLNVALESVSHHFIDIRLLYLSIGAEDREQIVIQKAASATSISDCRATSGGETGYFNACIVRPDSRGMNMEVTCAIRCSLEEGKARGVVTGVLGAFVWSPSAGKYRCMVRIGTAGMLTNTASLVSLKTIGGGRLEYLESLHVDV